MRRGVKQALQTGWLRPITGPLGALYRGCSTSLLYHRVVAGNGTALTGRCAGFQPNRCLAVPVERFDEQMRELARHHPVMALPAAVEQLVDGTLPRGTVTVSFDDGYRDNLTLALPVLERHGIPATIFVTTGLIDRTAVLWWEELEAIVRHCDRLEFEWNGQQHRHVMTGSRQRWTVFTALAALFGPLLPAAQQSLMRRLRDASGLSFDYDSEILDWDELRELDRHPLITVAAHTINHPVLSQIPADVAQREIRGSRERLEAELGHPVPFFAYPYGGPKEAGRREFGICAAQGFSFALTTRSAHWHRAHRDRLCALPRIMIEYGDTLDDFRFKLSGLEALIRQRGRRVVTE